MADILQTTFANSNTKSPLRRNANVVLMMSRAHSGRQTMIWTITDLLSSRRQGRSVIDKSGFEFKCVSNCEIKYV